MLTKHRRVARLGKLVNPYLARRKKDTNFYLLRRRGWDHAMRLGALVLRGSPKIDEPLEAAWSRCLTEFGIVAKVGHGTGDVTYYEEDVVQLYEAVRKSLPGDTDQQKFQHVFDLAPPWLLKFTNAFVTARAWGIKLPDLSDAPPAGYLGVLEGLKWPHLPKGTLQAGDRMPASEIAAEEARQLLALLHRPDEEWSRQDRRFMRELISRIREEELAGSSKRAKATAAKSRTRIEETVIGDHGNGDPAVGYRKSPLHSQSNLRRGQANSSVHPMTSARQALCGEMTATQWDKLEKLELAAFGQLLSKAASGDLAAFESVAPVFVRNPPAINDCSWGLYPDDYKVV